MSIQLHAVQIKRVQLITNTILQYNSSNVFREKINREVEWF